MRSTDVAHFHLCTGNNDFVLSVTSSDNKSSNHASTPNIMCIISMILYRARIVLNKSRQHPRVHIGPSSSFRSRERVVLHAPGHYYYRTDYNKSEAPVFHQGVSLFRPERFLYRYGLFSAGSTCRQPATYFSGISSVLCSNVKEQQSYAA